MKRAPSVKVVRKLITKAKRLKKAAQHAARRAFGACQKARAAQYKYHAYSDTDTPERRTAHALARELGRVKCYRINPRRLQ